MKKHKKSLLFYSLIDYIIPLGDHDLQRKKKFSKNFLNKLKFKNLERNKISLGPMNDKTIQFLILAVLLEYDSVKEMEKLKRHENDTLFLDTKEIFPGVELTVEDVQFVDHCLTKLHVDLESDDDKEFVLSANQLIFLLRGVMREYNIFVGNGEKLEI